MLEEVRGAVGRGIGVWGRCREVCWDVGRGNKRCVGRGVGECMG